MVFTTLKMLKVLIVSGIRVARPVNIGKLFFSGLYNMYAKLR